MLVNIHLFSFYYITNLLHMSSFKVAIFLLQGVKEEKLTEFQQITTILHAVT
jgi:hypothetical protein